MWFLMVTLGFTMTVEKPDWIRRTFGTLTWEEAQTVYKTPQDISAAVRQHVAYREDMGDEWASGKETWDRGFGDCEDFAACVADLCKAAGIVATIQVFSPKGSFEGHAVAMGSWNGRLWISSNGWYETVKSMDDAKAVIAKEQGSGWRHREIVTATSEEARSGSFALSVPAR